MRLNPRLLRQTLTVTVAEPGTEDPNTGAAVSGRPREVVRQPCSFQPVRQYSDGSLPPVSGVQADVPSFRCYTAPFPDPGPGAVYRVDGVPYPLARRVDLGGQGQVLELYFGQGGAP